MNLVERLRDCADGYEVDSASIYEAADRIEALEDALRLMNITADHLSAQNANYKEQVKELENENKDKSQLLSNYRNQITALVKEKHRREE